MRREHLVAAQFDHPLGSRALPLARPGRVTMQLIRRVHWRIYPFRVPKILAALALLGLLLWQVPAAREAGRTAYARVRADASAAIGYGRDLLRGNAPRAK